MAFINVSPEEFLRENILFYGGTKDPALINMIAVTARCKNFPYIPPNPDTGFACYYPYQYNMFYVFKKTVNFNILILKKQGGCHNNPFHLHQMALECRSFYDHFPFYDKYRQSPRLMNGLEYMPEISPCLEDKCGFINKSFLPAPAINIDPRIIICKPTASKSMKQTANLTIKFSLEYLPKAHGVRILFLLT